MPKLSKAAISAAVAALMSVHLATNAAPTSSANDASMGWYAPSPTISTDISSNVTTDATAPSAQLRARGGTEFGNLRGNADLLLWNLCSSIRSRQGHHQFEQIRTGAQTQKVSEEIAKVSAVPLPGAVWLFLMGLLGMAGSRITGTKATASTRVSRSDATMELRPG